MPRLTNLTKAIPQKLLEIRGLKVRNSSELVSASESSRQGVTVFVLLALHTWANLSFQVRSLENLEPRVETALAMCGQKQQEKIADATEAQAVTDWTNDNLSDILNDADHDVKDAQRRINSVKAKEKAKAKAGTEEAGDHSDDHHDDDDMED